MPQIKQLQSYLQAQSGDYNAIAKDERRIRYGAAEAIPPYFDRFIAALEAGEARTLR